MSARAALRAGTAAAHEEVDSLFSAFDLARRDAYRHFLLAQAAAFLPVEAALDAAGAARLVMDWPERRRSASLEADLTASGAVAPAAVDPPPFDTDEAVLGGIYVLEGSRLGGAVLSRSLPADVPNAFLGIPPDSRRWRKLLANLETLLYRHEQVELAVESARAVFACFARAGRYQLETLLRERSLQGRSHQLRP